MYNDTGTVHRTFHMKIQLLLFRKNKHEQRNKGLQRYGTPKAHLETFSSITHALNSSVFLAEKVKFQPHQGTPDDEDQGCTMSLASRQSPDLRITHYRFSKLQNTRYFNDTYPILCNIYCIQMPHQYSTSMLKQFSLSNQTDSDPKNVIIKFSYGIR